VRRAFALAEATSKVQHVRQAHLLQRRGGEHATPAGLPVQDAGIVLDEHRVGVELSGSTQNPSMLRSAWLAFRDATKSASVSRTGIGWSIALCRSELLEIDSALAEPIKRGGWKRA
jgi:hypothetical protein